MKLLSVEDWSCQIQVHKERIGSIADEFLKRRAIGNKHPVYDFLFTYYRFSPTKLKQWIPSFEEGLVINENCSPDYFNPYWFETIDGILRLNPDRLQGQALGVVSFVEQLCQAIMERAPRFGCFGLHEWAMVYRLSQEEIRHAEYPLRLSSDAIASFLESQHLCCTHYDAYRFFTPKAEPLNLFKPTLDSRIQNEQGGCLHANMDLYKWSTKLWPWIGSDFIAKAFILALEGRELDMRASPYDLKEQGYLPILIETDEGRKEYQFLQQQYAQKTNSLRKELADFCGRLRLWSR